MAANNNINLKKKERVKITKSFAAPDKDTFTFVFVKSKFGCLRVAQFIFTLLCWILSLHFKSKVENEDGPLLAFSLFATISSWIYSIFSLTLSLVIIKKCSHDLVRRIVITCCCLIFAVFCFISSSLIADYIRKLYEADWPCKEDAPCNCLTFSVVFGYFAMVCFIFDAWSELYVLKAIKDTDLISNNDEVEGRPARHHHRHPISFT